MSNLFPGNQPKASDERKDSSLRSPLFPRKDEAPGSPATGSSFASKEGDSAVPRAPLFPPRTEAGQTSQVSQTSQAPRTPLFPPRTEAAQGGQTGQTAQTPRAPLFPPRAEVGKAAVTGVAAPRAPLFPPRAEAAPGQTAQAPRAPLFPPRAEAGHMAGAVGSAVAAGAAVPAKPLFGAKPATPEASRPLFGARPAEPAKPLFGSSPASPAASKPLFSSNPAAPVKPLFSTTPPAPDAASFSAGGTAREIKVTDAEFIQLRDFLYEQAGIFIAENRKYLVENRLASRLRDLGLRNFGEYYNYLRFDNNKGKELNVFFENMTTNETSFFRNGPQLDVFRDKVLMKVIDECRSKGQKKLRIWSAGCSSGEEPYTLAMIIYEVLKQETPTWDIKITANDLSLAMLAAARRGIYNDYAIRTTPQDILDKYFTKEGNGLYRVDPKLQRLISFGQINLNDKNQLAKVERSQIVFCRNVIIYFDDEMKKNVITAFYDNLLPGGSLLIGHSESLHNISRAFKPEHYSGTIVYRKQA